MTELTVTQLNIQIKAALESHFSTLTVAGEISNLVSHTSGHIYFSLKDEESSVRCVLFKGNAAKLKFKLQNGQKVTLEAGLSVYAPRGEYQLIVSSVALGGKGSLFAALEELKKKLSAKGYFDPSNKKPLPKFPKKVALITSATGAALQDMLKIAQKRWLLCEFTLFNALVQGEAAAAQIAANIAVADACGFDVIVLARGGGSIEDLWAFNEEIVAEAMYKAATPTLTGIGHEIDFTIADFVADVRAPTPSAAIEILLPDKNEAYMAIDGMAQSFEALMAQKLIKKETELKHLGELFYASSPSARLEFTRAKIGLYEKKFDNAIRSILALKEGSISTLIASFEAKEPSKTFDQSLAMVVKEGKKIELKKLKKGDRFELQSKDAIVQADVFEKKRL